MRESVSKSFHLIFLIDCLFLDGDKNLLQYSEVVFSFSSPFAGGRVVYFIIT